MDCIDSGVFKDFMLLSISFEKPGNKIYQGKKDMKFNWDIRFTAIFPDSAWVDIFSSVTFKISSRSLTFFLWSRTMASFLNCSEMDAYLKYPFLRCSIASGVEA